MKMQGRQTVSLRDQRALETVVKAVREISPEEFISMQVCRAHCTFVIGALGSVYPRLLELTKAALVEQLPDTIAGWRSQSSGHSARDAVISLVINSVTDIRDEQVPEISESATPAGAKALELLELLRIPRTPTAEEFELIYPIIKTATAELLNEVEHYLVVRADSAH